MTGVEGRSILYLASSVFARGGIQRYTRYQINACRDALPNATVTVLTVNRRGPDDFEGDFQVDFSPSHGGPLRKLEFVARALVEGLGRGYDVVWANHISLAPLAVICSSCSRGAYTIANVYGHEVWTDVSPLRRWALCSVDRVISDCRFTARYVCETLGVDNHRVDVHWDPVDVTRFRPLDVDPADVLAKYGMSVTEGDFLVLTLGRVSKTSRHKGYWRMLDVVSEIVDSHIRYVIAGGGDDVQSLRTAVAARGLAGRVAVLGPVSEADLASVYNCADVFVLVSDRGHARGEGVPLTPLEAAACGVPVIVGDEDGSQELVDAGVGGYVVSPWDRTALRERIELLAGNPRLRQRLGAVARSGVVGSFSLQRFREQVLATTSAGLGNGASDSVGHDGKLSG